MPGKGSGKLKVGILNELGPTCAFCGMCEKTGVINSRTSMAIRPLTKQASCVTTPVSLLTALREKLPVVG